MCSWSIQNGVSNSIRKENLNLGEVEIIQEAWDKKSQGQSQYSKVLH